MQLDKYILENPCTYKGKELGFSVLGGFSVSFSGYKFSNSPLKSQGVFKSLLYYLTTSILNTKSKCNLQAGFPLAYPLFKV